MSWIETTDGDHGHGTEMRPVGSRMDLGAWHAVSSGDAVRRNLTKNLTSGLEEEPAWLKSNCPGPSVVPAANDSPYAAAQVVPKAVPLGLCTVIPEPKSA